MKHLCLKVLQRHGNYRSDTAYHSRQLSYSGNDDTRRPAYSVYNNTLVSTYTCANYNRLHLHHGEFYYSCQPISMKYSLTDYIQAWCMQRYYIKTSRHLKRLEAINLSPIYITLWKACKGYPQSKPSIDRKSTRLNSSHVRTSRMPSSAWKKKKQLTLS